jgi:predicted nucleic acid-binding protein
VASELRLYADSSALVKLVLTEPESRALGAYLEDHRLVTSEIALVEVVRAETAADPPASPITSAIPLFDRIDVVAVTRDLLRRAAELTSERLRSLDAVHLATALAVDPDELVAYDRRLLEAAAAAGLRTASPR